MASRNAERRESITRGTGNVFADLGFPDAAECQAKLRLAYALNQVLDWCAALAGRCGQSAGGHAAEGLRAQSLQAGGLLRRAPDEPVDSARPGCPDRDSAKAPLTEDWPDQRCCSLKGRRDDGLCRRAPQLQVPLVARPRNQPAFCIDEVAGILATFCCSARAPHPARSTFSAILADRRRGSSTLASINARMGAGFRGARVAFLGFRLVKEALTGTRSGEERSALAVVGCGS